MYSGVEQRERGELLTERNQLQNLGGAATFSHRQLDCDNSMTTVDTWIRKFEEARCQWLTLVILATCVAEITKIRAQAKSS
jgi:hypothetical protein